jgi:hypothetical protein
VKLSSATSIFLLRDQYCQYFVMVATGGGYYDKSFGVCVIVFALPQSSAVFEEGSRLVGGLMKGTTNP